MSEFTPGPWHEEGHMIVAENGEMIADFIPLEANAQLIIAAPKLYEALKEIYEYMDETGYVCECKNEEHCLMCNAKLALAKAEGKARAD